jgi:DNA-binding MarR family transcriptional regulator
MQSKTNLLPLFQSIGKKWMKLVDCELYPHGITHAEARLLMLIYSNDGCTQESLAEGAPVDRSNTGRALKKLEKAGHIVRRKDEADARAFRIYLTDRGRKLKIALNSVQEKLESCITGGLNPVELKKLTSLMQKLDDSFSRSIHQAH